MVNPGGHQKSSDNENQREKTTCFSGTQNSISLKLIAKAGPEVLPLLATTTYPLAQITLAGHKSGSSSGTTRTLCRGNCPRIVETQVTVNVCARLRSQRHPAGPKTLHEPRKVIDCRGRRERALRLGRTGDL